MAESALEQAVQDPPGVMVLSRQVGQDLDKGVDPLPDRHLPAADHHSAYDLVLLGTHDPAPAARLGAQSTSTIPAGRASPRLAASTRTSAFDIAGIGARGGGNHGDGLRLTRRLQRNRQIAHQSPSGSTSCGVAIT